MFHSIQVDRFRGFRKLEIDNLDRFNLFLGRNNVGKTAFLESIFLLLGPTNPQLPLTLSVNRGMDRFLNDPDELWGWLFYDKDMTRPIFLKAKLLDGKSRILQISLGDPKDPTFKRGKTTAQVRSSVSTTTTDVQPSELVLKYRDETGARIVAKASIKDDTLTFHRSGSLRLPTGIMISARVGYAPENATRFSKLEELSKGDEILPALRLLEPRLKRLAVLVTGSGPVIHGDIGIGRMVPVPMMGEGTGRLLTLLLAIHEASSGTVLIDEIDSGFHYSSLASVWSALTSVARTLDVQIFCTSHSWECVKAAHEAFSLSTKYDFRIHRLDRKDQEIKVVNLDKEMIETALTSGLELR